MNQIPPGYPQFQNAQYPQAPAQGVPPAPQYAPAQPGVTPQGAVPQYATQYAPMPGGVPTQQPGYGQPPYGAPGPNPYAQQAPQFAEAPAGFTPQPQNFGGMPGGGDLGAAIAGANLGVTRYPSLPAGDHVVVIDMTKKPERSVALVAEYTVESTTSTETAPGKKHSFYQNLAGGKPETLAAQQGGALAFLLRVSGYSTLEALKASGNGGPAWAAHINSCFVGPGPLVGRRVGVRVRHSGKFTKPKMTPQGPVGGNEPIMNHDWHVV
jgi:hypothetical protein